MNKKFCQNRTNNAFLKKLLTIFLRMRTPITQTNKLKNIGTYDMTTPFLFFFTMFCNTASESLVSKKILKMSRKFQLLNKIVEKMW